MERHGSRLDPQWNGPRNHNNFIHLSGPHGSAACVHLRVTGARWIQQLRFLQKGCCLSRPGRANPYFYTDEEIQRLLDAAKSMSAQFPLHRSTYHCLLGLLAVSGMRISEALNLELRDIDWVEALLTIRSTKFGKSRLVPLHPTAKMVLSDYVSLRNEFFCDRPTSVFFPSKTGARLDEGQVRRVFYRLSRQVGIRGASASRGPRLHDFRHRFAVETLLRGIAAEKTLHDACQFSPPTSDMLTSQIPTSI